MKPYMKLLPLILIGGIAFFFCAFGSNCNSMPWEQDVKTTAGMNEKTSADNQQDIYYDDDGFIQIDSTCMYNPDIDYGVMNQTEMKEWAKVVRGKEIGKVGRLQKELTALVMNSNELSKAMAEEIAAWQTACLSFDKFTDAIIELAYWAGGSMRDFSIADTRMYTQFIRRACLDDDYALIKNHKTDSKQISDAKEFLFNGIDSAYCDLEISKIYQDEEILKYMDKMYFPLSGRSKKGGVMLYKERYKTLGQIIIRFKKDITSWISARENVMKLLPEEEQGTYSMHTKKVIMSLTNNASYF